MKVILFVGFYLLGLVACSVVDRVGNICTELGIRPTGADKSFSHGDSCFEISTDKLKFEDAKTKCTKHEPGHLANLNAEQIKSLNASLQLFLAGPHTSYWIGLYQQLPAEEPSGGWYWLLSGGGKRLASEISWGIWDRNRNPDNINNQEHCGTLFQHGINDDWCAKPLKYICEYHRNYHVQLKSSCNTKKPTNGGVAIMKIHPKWLKLSFYVILLKFLSRALTTWG